MHFELRAIAWVMIILTMSFHFIAQILVPVAYARFFNPWATTSLIGAGMLSLMLARLNRYALAWFCIIFFAIFCGFLLSGIPLLGMGYSLALYILATFLAVLALPKYGWQIGSVLSLIAISADTVRQLQAATSDMDVENVVLGLVTNGIILGVSVFMMQLLHRRLNQHIGQLKTVNNALFSSNSDLQRR